MFVAFNIAVKNGPGFMSGREGGAHSVFLIPPSSATEKRSFFFILKEKSFVTFNFAEKNSRGFMSGREGAALSFSSIPPSFATEKGSLPFSFERKKVRCL